MKKLGLIFTFITCSINCMNDELPEIFKKLQNPIDKNFKGTSNEYRSALLQKIETILPNQIDLKSYNISGETKCHGESLIYRAAQNNVPKLTQLLAQTSHKQTLGRALWQAAFCGYDCVVTVLLKSSAPATWQSETYLGTPLHNAASQGHIKTVSAIINYALETRRKEILTEQDAYSRTPLDYANEAGRPEIIVLLETALNSKTSN